MSEKGPEADIEPRHVNVAEVPIGDIRLLGHRLTASAKAERATT
jgi:hypothetical protein